MRVTGPRGLQRSGQRVLRTVRRRAEPHGALTLLARYLRFVLQERAALRPFRVKPLETGFVVGAQGFLELCDVLRTVLAKVFTQKISDQ